MRSSILTLASTIRMLIFSAFIIGGLAGSAEARVFKLVTIEGSPFGFMDAEGKPDGINVEVGNLIFEEAGLSYENTIVPFVRAIAMIESGEADFMIAFPNARLEAAATPVAIVARLENIVIGRTGTAFHTLKDLHGKTVASVRGAEYDSAFSADESIIKHRVNNYEHGLSMLLAARLDAIVGMKIGLYYQLDAMGGSRRQLGEPLALNKKSAWLFFARRSHDRKIATKLTNAVAVLNARDAIERIQVRYFGSPATTAH